jgi:MFS family permease
VGGALGLLRRNPDYRRLFVATLVTNGGDWFALIPLLALLHESTGSGLYGGLVLAADTALFALLAPYGGTIADRFDRKTIIVTAEAVCAVLVLSLLLVGEGTEWLAVLAIGGVAAAKGFTSPAGSAATPNLVRPEDLATATVMNAVSWGSMLAIGAALGGLLTALVGPDVCFVLDAISFAVSAWLVWRCRTPFQQPRESREHPHFLTSVREAVTYARGHHAVLALLFAKPGIAFANGALVLFPLLATDVFKVGDAGLGLMYAGRGLGVVLGPLLLGTRGREGTSTWWVLSFGTAACGLLYVGVALSPWFGLVLVLITLAHLGGGTNWTVTTYGLQRRVPDVVLGRIFSADAMFVTLAIAVNQALAGVLSDLVDTRTLVAVFGLASVAYAAVWFAATRSLRETPLETGA